MSLEPGMASVTRFLKAMLTHGRGDLNVEAACVASSAGVPSLSGAHIKLSIIPSNNTAIIICNEIYIPLLYCNRILQ